MLTVEEARMLVALLRKTGRLDCTANQLILMYQQAIAYNAVKQLGLKETHDRS
jgi:hypothetical protein